MSKAFSNIAVEHFDICASDASILLETVSVDLNKQLAKA